MSKTTIKNLASSLGVSTATVSRAFTGKGRISDRTRIKILKKAEEVGYRANIYARSLTGKSSETIGLFYPSLVNGEPDYFINEIMSGISETIAGSNKNLQIFPIQQKMAEKVIEFYKDVIFNGSISAVIVIYGSLSAITLVEMAKSVNIPYIVIGDIEGEEKNSISYHIENGAQQVGEYLLTSGKKKPAYVGGVNDSPKRKGFLRGLGCLAEKVCLDVGGATFSDGEQAFCRLHSKSLEIDSVFCANDILAIGFIRAAVSTGIKIPDEIAVIGCDDIRIAMYYNPSLTTISFKEYEIGRQAVLQLFAFCDKNIPITGKSIVSELVIRESA